MAKELIVIRESFPLKNAIRRIKQISYAEYKYNSPENYGYELKLLKGHNEISYFLQKSEAMFDGTLGIYTGSDYTIE